VSGALIFGAGAGLGRAVAAMTLATAAAPAMAARGWRLHQQAAGEWELEVEYGY
jgi:hypothetical protein